MLGWSGSEESLDREDNFLDPLIAFAAILLDGFTDAVPDVVVE